MPSATRRRLYAGGRPGGLARLLNRGQAALHSAGIWPERLATLEVAGRRTGRRIAAPGRPRALPVDRRASLTELAAIAPDHPVFRITAQSG